MQVRRWDAGEEEEEGTGVEGKRKWEPVRWSRSWAR